MLSQIIQFSLKNKLIVMLFTLSVVGYGIYALMNIPIGAVPDITNNQVQVITTSRNLSTQDVEQFLTYPIELEMANLPGVVEIRSTSKFGLSVVTIVFEDKMGTYLPRQLIAEKIKKAAETIPEGFGTPEMGPITTGLGEIYQYILEVAPEYKERYTPMDLRTIQDWIVKRQLSGIPGVVEVNTWGGFLKQYEVTINPEQNLALNIPIIDVFTALEKNNSVAGGGYIEKENQSYFIRGEGLIGSLEDIENIIVTYRNDLPVYIKDIATVGYGYATRFGAVTSNGEGETILGQVMMLKDANSKEVIEAVKQRVAQVQQSLPPGISINPFLERSELIAKTTFTITENLIVGCLIVVFVVVLLLGNWRSGLVVASVIPLCLLFAISLMYIFGIDANLMSLGAIDFGIIIDGAVIIVEFIAFQITSKRIEFEGMGSKEKADFLDKTTHEAANKMMRSAVFGQLIIVIVFIPILSLTGVEGKMFIPMALTFCFALTGAMIFCFTYVPVVSSLFLRPSNEDPNSISNRLMSFLQNLYKPVLIWSMGHRKTVIGMALAMLVGSGYLFTTMGGEFVPTLDEGDFVIQPILKTGTSLTKTVEMTTRIEKIIKRFPEVKQVVTRIGAAEVPTDPMSIEETDVMITLRDKGTWTSASTKDELADKFKEALTAEIPGVDYEFTQPIEMRFNELITGVRADLAIKIFGEDLDILYKKGLEIQALIKDVPGAADISVEKIAGLPQMQVKYDRRKIARYGLNIQDVNEVITMGFSGKSAGSVFEGERRFDLVVRFSEDFRKDIKNLENTFVPTPNGKQIPISELATITYTKGPNQISRDNTKRRMVVGVNVRNRDLESVVKDVQKLIDNNIFLPPGYLVTYGGQFENLRSAKARLSIAVPISLVLIFILLHFAFQSLRDALIVYSAIPMAAIGGVLLLWLRDLPFSISAGVGFIALFGIAVLNGIVLIDHFKSLKKEGMDNIRERIFTGAVQRLRPVLLTAAAAALGFLPMAVSGSVGAEVQRPLATVVIGGLVTSTLLTLIVLPVLYSIFDKDKMKLKVSPKALFVLLFLLPSIGIAQSSDLTLAQAQSIAKANNAKLKASALAIEESAVLKVSEIEKTSVFYNYDQNNIAQNNSPLKVWGIQQNFEFPTVYGAKKDLQESQVRLRTHQYAIEERLLTKEVAAAYDQILFLKQLKKDYTYLDSLYSHFAKRAKRSYEEGETNYLMKITAQSKQNEVALLLKQLNLDLQTAHLELSRLMQSDEQYTLKTTAFERIALIPLDTTEHPGIHYFQESITSANQLARLEKRKMLPDIQLEYFQGTNDLANAATYSGFQIGLGIPLFYGSQKSKIKSAQISSQRMAYEAENYQITLNKRVQQLSSDLNKESEALNNYDELGRDLVREIIHTSNRSLEHGAIDFFQYIQSIDRAVSIEINYLESLRRYNKTALEINYIIN